MSQENIEIVRRGVEAWQRGQDQYDISTPNSSGIFQPTPGYTLPLRGRVERTSAASWRGAVGPWTDYQVALKDLIDGGTEVVVVIHETARLKETEMLIERDLAQMLTLREGRSHDCVGTGQSRRPSKPWGCGSGRSRNGSWMSYARVTLAGPGRQSCFGISTQRTG